MTLNTKIEGFMDFRVIFGCETHFKSELSRKSRDTLRQPA